MSQALYSKLEASRIFPTQAEAIAWGRKKKEDYKAAGETVKVDTNPTDATRRRWITEVFLKSTEGR